MRERRDVTQSSCQPQRGSQRVRSPHSALHKDMPLICRHFTLVDSVHRGRTTDMQGLLGAVRIIKRVLAMRNSRTSICNGSVSKQMETAVQKAMKMWMVSIQDIELDETGYKRVTTLRELLLRFGAHQLLTS